MASVTASTPLWKLTAWFWHVSVWIPKSKEDLWGHALIRWASLACNWINRFITQVVHWGWCPFSQTVAINWQHTINVSVCINVTFIVTKGPKPLKTSQTSITVGTIHSGRFSRLPDKAWFITPENVSTAPESRVGKLYITPRCFHVIITSLTVDWSRASREMWLEALFYESGTFKEWIAGNAKP